MKPMLATFLLGIVVQFPDYGRAEERPQAAAEKQAKAAGVPVTVEMRKQLFVDDHVVAEKTGVTRVLGQATKANGGKPVFTDGWFYGNVLHDDGKFKLWFRKPDNQGYGYAESADGLRFEKKEDVTGIPFAGDINLAVEIEANEKDPAHRFKASYNAKGMAAGLAHSADGVRWTAYHQGRPVTYRAADTYNQVLWDGEAKVYRLFTRTDYGTGGGPQAGTVAKDFEVRGTRGMVNPDVKADSAKWELVREWYFNREGKEEFKRRQVYALTLWIYHGVYFALLSVYEWPGDVSEGKTTDHHKRHERDVMNFYIATSRDADAWDLQWGYAGKPLVPRGPDGTFDKDMVFPASTVVTYGDQHWLYYAGADERHGTAEVKPPVHFDRHHAIGLATLRLDGFVGLEATDQEGTVVTKPFRLDGTRLEVNVDAKKGSAAVEVLDEKGQPVPEFAGADVLPEEGVDAVRWRPRWKDAADLAALKGKVIRLKLRLQDARLYAFQVQ